MRSIHIFLQCCVTCGAVRCGVMRCGGGVCIFDPTAGVRALHAREGSGDGARVRRAGAGEDHHGTRPGRTGGMSTWDT